MSIITIPQPFYLYRGDDSEPLSAWDSAYAKKTRYGTISNKLGPKNQAGFFFLSDNKGMAEGYCEGITKRPDVIGSPEFWITTTQTRSALQILDFSNSREILEVLCILKDQNLDVMTEDFMAYDELGGDCADHVRNFSLFKRHYEKGRELMNKPDLTGKEREHLTVARSSIKLLGPVGHTVSLFGQRLTDFKNGVQFRSLVADRGVQIDGYRWREHDDPRGLTYCLFSSDKLRPPTKERFIIPPSDHV